jgi:ornithine cyclodeaminase
MQELDPKILAMADIVCTDSIEACAKNGELHHALDMGYIEQDKVFELGEAITTKIQRELTDITVCDLVGIGFQDAVIASCVMSEYDRQRKHEDTHEIK